MISKTICYPSKQSFPSISVTGDECFFSCDHCRHKYLKFMTYIKPENLYEKAIELEKKGAKGILISGGLDRRGKVPVDYSIIKKIKEDTKLIINLHCGFIDRNDSKEIKNSKVDAVSVDFVGSNETINNILNIPFTVKDYENNVKYLTDEGVNTVPHICVGLDRGKIVGEYESLKILKKYPIDSITLLVLIKNEMDKTKNFDYDIQSIKDFFIYTREEFPQINLSLGCMRPRIKELDETAIIFDNIVNPTKEMIKLIRNEHDIVVKYICCSLC